MCQGQTREVLREESLIRSLICSKYINPNSTEVAGASPSLCLLCAFYFGSQVVRLAVSLKIRPIPFVIIFMISALPKAVQQSRISECLCRSFNTLE